MADTDHEEPTPGQEQGKDTQENPAPPAGDEDEQPTLTIEQYQANATRANQQAAAERVKRQEALTELEGMRTRISDMKSIEEVDALVAEYQSKVTKAEETTNRVLAAEAAGLPAGFGSRLKGATYEELLADAKEFAETITIPKGSPDPLNPAGGRDPRTSQDKPKPGSDYHAAKAKHSNF